MASNAKGVKDLNPDVLRLTFDQLAGDYETLLNVSLVSRSWRDLSWPSLLRIVDVSSHNNGRLPQHECSVLPIVYADYDGQYRPDNLFSRQRAFLRLMTDSPGLAKYVKSLTWTLIWRQDCEGENLAEIDRQTWTVFSRMESVCHLDLASLPESGDMFYVWQNPSRLFPAVEDLRLLGWMHRGLVKAIITSLDSSKLRRLSLDYLQDEGTLPDGTPLPDEIAEDHAPSARKYYLEHPDGVVDEDLFQRQQSGRACAFPGPMWYPLKLLATRSLASLIRFQIKLAPFSFYIDLRNYYTMFQETANMITRTKASLKSLIVSFGENASAVGEHTIFGCGTMPPRFRQWGKTMTAAFLKQLLAALRPEGSTNFDFLRFEGFRILDQISHTEAENNGISDLPHSTFAGIELTKHPNVDYRDVYAGFERAVPDIEGLSEILEQS